MRTLYVAGFYMIFRCVMDIDDLKKKPKVDTMGIFSVITEAVLGVLMITGSLILEGTI